MAMTDIVDDLVDIAADSDPAEFAASLAHAGDAEWLDAFTVALNRQRSANRARYIFAAWGINHSEAGRIFGVTRQAVSRWTTEGIPASQEVTFADLAAATDILTHYLRSDRIPAVVRRPAPALDGQSLIDLLRNGRSADIVAACAAMFQFGDAHR